MLFKSSMVGPASGRLAGSVASHNKGGQYFRQLRIPTNPSTVQQQVVRDAIKTLATRWVEVLTPTQRESWKTYAQNVPLINRLGDARVVPELAQYSRSNVSRIQAGLPIVDDGPGIFDLGTFTAPVATVAAAGTTASFAFTPADDWANEDDAAMLIYTARAQNASKLFFKGPYRFAGSILGDSGTPPTSPAVITLPFPVGASGQLFYFSVAVTRGDGRLATSFRGFDVVP